MQLNLPKNKFIKPQGWDWEGPWSVSLDASLLYDADAGLEHFLEDCFEQQIRYVPGGEFSAASTPFTNVKGDPVLPKDKIECTHGWEWDDAWQVDINRACDEEGYEYCVESTSAAWTPACKTYHMCRRKRWVRPRSLIKGFKVEEAKEEHVGDDWEYAPMFNMRFHATERKMDLVKRRRWHRKMVAKTEHAASIFSLKRAITDDKHEKQDQPVPRILLEPKETHKYQLRAYMFQARNLIAADSDSFSGKYLISISNLEYKLKLNHLMNVTITHFKMHFSDPFAFVSLLFRSQRTHIIRHSLSPSWDQTLIFEEIVVHGSPDFLARHPPDVVVEIFDYDAYRNDEFLGRVIIKPLVKVDPSDRQVCRLGWHSLQRGTRPAGELLASFELFLAKNHSDLPFLPPMKKDRYVVPSGIRPVMQRTVVEILCWGLRNMAKYMQMSVDSPSVEFEIGGKVVESEVISNLKKSPNFSNPVLVVVVDLPREELYTPPINIKVRDHRAFGRKPVVGIATINGLGRYRRLDSVSTVLSDDEPDVQGPPLLTVTDTADEGPGKRSEYTVIDVDDQKDSKVTFKEEDRKTKRKKFSVGGFRKFQWWQKSKSLDPEAVAEEEIDWWSKYYASKGDIAKCVSYMERGYDIIQILPGELEDQPSFQGFSDFFDTFELARGKASTDGGPTLTGEFKGSFKIYPMPHELKEPVSPMFIKPSELPSTGLVEVLVRVYVVRAYQLCPQDTNGLSDPYIIVKLGKTVLDDVKKFIPNTLEPFFGRLFELKTTLPLHKDLRIQVMDKDFLSRDDMIGETVIDLENRYLSRYRATCGLPETYNITGPNIWRDSATPRQLLAEYCIRNSMAPPKFENAEPPTVVEVGGETYRLAEIERHKQRNEHWGPADQRLALYVLHAQGLVREHVETRCLYNSAMPDLPQGQLEMWVDMFPTDPNNPAVAPGPPFHISPRIPKKFQVRCIIWNTMNVDLQEVSITGERMSDIYIKGWLSGVDEKQETDVHYRSLNGEGNFNWRFVFDMNYIPPEQVIVVKKKEHFWSVSETETRVPATLVIQIWDNDKFSADDFIGTLELDLNRMMSPIKKVQSCTIERLPEGDDPSPNMSLFERKRVKGWWPCYNVEGEDGKKKLAGKVEMELEILDESEINERPTAQGRDEPNQHPHLDEPNRPETSFLWFTSPWKSLRFVIWNNFKWRILIGLLIVLLIIFFILFIYNIPSASINSVFIG
nr:myoferlin-like [Lytechinus pictus]